VQAVVAAAERERAWDAWEADLDVLRGVIADDTVRTFLLHAGLPLTQRVGLIDRIPEEGLGVNGRGLARLLIERRDVDLVPDIEAAFVRRADEARNVDRVRVTTAVALTDTEFEDLRTRLAEPGRELRLSADTDPSILGGFVVRRGDNLLDLSVRARLQSLAGALR
jgi:F-type H+-transporting ATPase subunit delta